MKQRDLVIKRSIIKKSTPKEWRAYHLRQGYKELADKIFVSKTAPITGSTDPYNHNQKFQASPVQADMIWGHWCEDGSPYSIRVPEQLRDGFVLLLNTLVEERTKYEKREENSRQRKL
jgi:hypothetical protein